MSYLLVFMLVILYWAWTVSPGSTAVDEVEPADAVVMFVGGQGERLVKAVELMNAGIADTLVIPNGSVPGWPDANRFCEDGAPGLRVVCPTPYPDDTRGEARVIGELASYEGWDSVVMVTSEYHLSRARLKLRRCFDGEITAVAAHPEDESLMASASRNLYEFAGHIEARLLERGC